MRERPETVPGYQQRTRHKLNNARRLHCSSALSQLSYNDKARQHRPINDALLHCARATCHHCLASSRNCPTVMAFWFCCPTGLTDDETTKTTTIRTPSRSTSPSVSESKVPLLANEQQTQEPGSSKQPPPNKHTPVSSRQQPPNKSASVSSKLPPPSLPPPAPKKPPKEAGQLSLAGHAVSTLSTGGQARKYRERYFILKEIR